MLSDYKFIHVPLSIWIFPGDFRPVDDHLQNIVLISTSALKLANLSLVERAKHLCHDYYQQLWVARNWHERLRPFSTQSMVLFKYSNIHWFPSIARFYPFPTHISQSIFMPFQQMCPPAWLIAISYFTYFAYMRVSNVIRMYINKICISVADAFANNVENLLRRQTHIVHYHTAYFSIFLL